MENQNAFSPVKSRRLFFSGVVLLGGAGILVKVIGLLFKIPMSHYLGDEGMGYFNSAYQIYSWLYILATAGFPVALSLMISKSLAIGDIAAVKKTERVAWGIFAFLGLCGAALMIFCRAWLADGVGTPDAQYGIAAMAPALLFICLSSAVRGYYQGFGRMAPSAISQVIESLGKLLAGVLLASYASARALPLPLIAAYGVAGLSLGEGLALLFLLAVRALAPPLKTLSQDEERKAPRVKTILSRLVKIALPITASASVLSIAGLLDLVLVQRRLQEIGYTVKEATAFYGNYTTLVVPLFHLPPTLIYPLATAALPLLSAKIAARERASAAQLSKSLLRISSLIATPCAMGLGMFALPILSLLFPQDMAEKAAPLLLLLSPAVLFLSLLSVSNAILQANGKENRPMFSMLVGGGVKLLASYLLLGVPQIAGAGVPLGSVLCYLFALFCNLLFLKKDADIELRFSSLFFTPLLASLLSVGGGWGCYAALCEQIGQTLSLFTGIAVSVLLYSAVLLFFGMVSEEEWRLVPFGRKIASKIGHKVCKNTINPPTK